MSDFISKAVANPKIQLAATATVSVALTACTILGYQHLERRERLSYLKDSIPSIGDIGPPDQKPNGTRPPTSQSPAPSSSAALPDKENARNEELARRALAGDFDDELILEQLARNRVFLKPEGLDTLRKSFIIVVGCGGVGSHCAAALARSGVSKIRLVDFDQVTLSSLNRHAVATLHDVGTPKVTCLRKRLIAITPWVKFDLRNEKFDSDSADSLLAPFDDQKPDFVVDAIDNIDTKVALLKFCYDHKIPVISSMGAGCKSDPAKIHVADISTGTDDGLARSTRRRLKLLGITKGIPIVYSSERAGEGKAELMPLPDEEFQKGSVGDLGVLPDFRVRILPVLGTMPAVFGYTVANHIILSITGYPIDYRQAKGRDKMYDTIHAYIQGSEERIARAAHPDHPDIATGLKLPLNIGHIAFVVEESFRGVSIISTSSTRLVLVRWRKPSGDNVLQIAEQKSSILRLSELVCMTKDEALRHEKEVHRGSKTPEELYDAETIERAEAGMKESEAYAKYMRLLT